MNTAQFSETTKRLHDYFYGIDDSPSVTATPSPFGKIGFVASAFDLLHAGHLALLEEAKKHCDYLVVALHVDPSQERGSKNSPVESVFERYQRLSACRFVDRIIPYETEADLFNILAILKPEVRFLGADYIGKSFTGKEMSIKVIYLDRSHNFSSSELRSRLLKKT